MRAGETCFTARGIREIGGWRIYELMRGVFVFAALVLFASYCRGDKVDKMLQKALSDFKCVFGKRYNHRLKNVSAGMDRSKYLLSGFLRKRGLSSRARTKAHVAERGGAPEPSSSANKVTMVSSIRSTVDGIKGYLSGLGGRYDPKRCTLEFKVVPVFTRSGCMGQTEFCTRAMPAIGNLAVPSEFMTR